jgi:glycosyltransferase involved in cell wall biosynthesis
LGYQPDDAVVYYMQNARAFVFAAEEDFGILPVEAQACGTPVIAYGCGGVTETVRPGETGLFFHEQTADALAKAVRTFEAARDRFEPDVLRAQAERFAPERFRSAFHDIVMQAHDDFQHGTHWRADPRTQFSDAAA